MKMFDAFKDYISVSLSDITTNYDKIWNKKDAYGPFLFIQKSTDGVWRPVAVY